MLSVCVILLLLGDSSRRFVQGSYSIVTILDMSFGVRAGINVGNVSVVNSDVERYRRVCMDNYYIHGIDFDEEPNDDRSTCI